MSSDIDFLFKILMIGGSRIIGVGKSSLVLKFVDDTYSEGPGINIGTDYKSRIINIDGAKIKLQLWDNKKISPVVSSSYHGAHGICIVYDVTDAESFNKVNFWFNEITKYAKENVNKLLVGNKSDLVSERVVTFDQGLELAKSMGVEFIETSAKNPFNVEKAFTIIATQIKERYQSDLKRGVKLSSGQGKQDNRCGCC